jgi:type II secretory pathway pseudopilin PulG
MAAAKSRPPAAARRRGEVGLTLIEVVVAIAVIAIGVIGIAYGFTAATTSAATSQEQAALGAAAQQIESYIQSNPDVSGSGLRYTVCASSYSLTSPPSGSTRPPTPPAGITWAVSGVNKTGSLSGMSFPGGQPDPWGNTIPASCGPSGSTDYGVQEIHITITTTRGNQTITATVWKGDL